MSIREGTLYIVATPIGNLGDITHRAVDVLQSVDVIYAEDTRHSGRLLQHAGISSVLRSLHEHNETQRVADVVSALQCGGTAAVISDAGTPLVSDPGYRLVAECHALGIAVSPIPGPSAVIAALCVSGLPTDSFVYLGFPPARSAARRAWLESHRDVARTMVIYESKHRITATLDALQDAFGAERVATIARELTKAHETVRRDTLANLLCWINADAHQQKGEFVIVVSGAEPKPADQPELERVLMVLLQDLSVKQSSVIAAKLTRVPRQRAYALALTLKRVTQER